MTYSFLVAKNQESYSLNPAKGSILKKIAILAFFTLSTLTFYNVSGMLSFFFNSPTESSYIISLPLLNQRLNKEGWAMLQQAERLKQLEPDQKRLERKRIAKQLVQFRKWKERTDIFLYHPKVSGNSPVPPAQLSIEQILNVLEGAIPKQKRKPSLPDTYHE